MTQFPIASMCRLLQVSRSGCYAAANRPINLRSREDLALRARIEQLHEEHRRAPGVIKTWQLLLREGYVCGRNRVARLRRIAGIETLRTRKFRKTRIYQRTEPPAPDLVQRRFKVATPNRIWVGDMTQILTRTGPIHLAVYVDLCSHQVKGWATSTSQTGKLAVTALQAGIERQMAVSGLICHTDQGAPYASKMYRDHLQDHGIVPSMSRKGNCFDNAVAESFFSSLKNELTHHTLFQDYEAAKLAIGEYIDVYYNQQRLHQSLGYLTPAQAEAMHTVAN